MLARVDFVDNLVGTLVLHSYIYVRGMNPFAAIASVKRALAQLVEFCTLSACFTNYSWYFVSSWAYRRSGHRGVKQGVLHVLARPCISLHTFGPVSRVLA